MSSSGRLDVDTPLRITKKRVMSKNGKMGAK